MSALCLDCGVILAGFPRRWSEVYLCPRCRDVRYVSEAHAAARIMSGLERRGWIDELPRDGQGNTLQ